VESNEYQPEHFGKKGGVWGADLKEGILYRGSYVAATVFRKVGEQVQYKRMYDTPTQPAEWIDCNPDKRSIFFPVEDAYLM